MPRLLNLRQIEAFKAVIESGTVSGGALMLNISQPAMSKLIAHMEEDTGLKLFDRLKGRLAPTDHAMRLYQEVDRIFAGVRQVQSAVEAIRREEHERLTIGAIAALSGPFLTRATTEFLKQRGNVFCSIQGASSQMIVEWLVSRKLDVGLVSSSFDNPYVISDRLMEHPLVCIMPLDHPLVAKAQIELPDLRNIPFVAFTPETYIGHGVDAMFETYKVRPQIVLLSNTAPRLCDFVAAGLGISLVHPLMVSGMEDRVAVRRFEPAIPYAFHLCRSADSRNTDLIECFAQELRTAAAQVSLQMLGEPT